MQAGVRWPESAVRRPEANFRYREQGRSGPDNALPPEMTQTRRAMRIAAKAVNGA